jgi:hypothetical protein
MKVMRVALLCTGAVFLAGPVQAAPVTAFVLAFSGSASISAAVAAVVYPGITAVASFLGQTVLGNLIISALTSYLATPKAGGQDLESVRLNSRVSDPKRFQLGARVAAGGASGAFGEFDENGNFWYFILHGDAEMLSFSGYILDGITVELSDGTDDFVQGDVITADFCLNEKNEPYEDNGTRVPQIRIFTVTPTINNPIGEKPTEFIDAFAEVLPTDFNLAGICYSIVKIKAVELEHRHKVYRWRGPMGLGEPSVSLIADFNRMYDHRDAAQDLDIPTTWLSSDGNSALVWAWWRTHRFGRNRPMSEVNWEKVAFAADICDEQPLDRSGNGVPRYRCGIAAEDSTTRKQIEDLILLTCDGFVAYDDAGRAYPVVGKYSAPTLTFSAARDIISARTESVDDGESAVDGVVVNYTSADHGFRGQPCAPWQNPEFFDAAREPNYAYVDILGCQNHNQAFRLAGAIGARIAPPRRAALGCTVKGILARSERAILLEYDSIFTGDYEIASPVVREPSGVATAFAVVPLLPDRWEGAGQSEGVPPAIAPALDIDDSLSGPENVSIIVETIRAASGVAARFSATFDAPTRPDRFYQFRYTKPGTNIYEYFQTDMGEQRAFSAIVDEGLTYEISAQTSTAGGRASGWEILSTLEVNADTSPDQLQSATAVAGLGSASFSIVAPSWENFKGVRVYRTPESTAFATDELVLDTVELAPSSSVTVIAGDSTTSDLIANGGFDDASSWTFYNGWNHNVDRATHTPNGSGSTAIQTVAGVVDGAIIRFGLDVANATTGAVGFRANGATSVNETTLANGVFIGEIVSPPSVVSLGLVCAASFDGDVDNVSAFIKTPNSLPQGTADYWVVPVSQSNTEGKPSGPFTLKII